MRVAGKFFAIGADCWPLKGLTYGPFARNSRGEFLPEPGKVVQDFAHMRELGAACIRLYHLPCREFLDHATAAGLRVFVDVPWDKHRCFFEDWSARAEAVAAARRAARELGSHPALFALSIGNEIPKDVVRFYGGGRVERFIGQLLDAAKQEAPDCLVTYTNYPSTEFLTLAGQDFCCFNVYLDDADALGRYLDHLQHVAGPLPLVLGEHGIDSLRHGVARQADVLRNQVREVFRHGLAGSFVFSYTDDWYTGGYAVDDWAFGVTDRSREEKPAAAAVRAGWSAVGAQPDERLPAVSVVVCSYNGAATLGECIRSLARLEYPRYEVILVDDGSTDETPRIAAEFPKVKYLRQENRGLSAARNAGAAAATGEVVAYTDSDCVAHEAWLAQLVGSMREQGVAAIGGPNVPPTSDGWTAKCVAASPGGPSHVMLDDRRAEHVPGCNMAFDRRRLLEIGGFDPQFRQAGDDVDICWRFLDAGQTIGYAPAALVWHHRRQSVGAYLRQQKGYGRAEAMLRLKHPRRFNALGCSRWRGVIYGDGAVGLPVCAPAVYHGRFGSGLFQTVYHRTDYSPWAYFVLLEWHVLATALAAAGLVVPPLGAVAAAMWCATLIAALRSAHRAVLPKGAPWWCRPLVFALHLAQPVARAWHRYRYRLRHKRLPLVPAPSRRVRACRKTISFLTHDLYWSSTLGLGRERFLDALQFCAARFRWPGNFDDEWRDHDVELDGDAWHDLRVHTATEELGGRRRFTRVRCSLRWTGATAGCFAVAAFWALAVAVHPRAWSVTLAAVLWMALAGATLWSRLRCRSAVSRLIWRAARRAALDPVTVRGQALRPAPTPKAKVTATATPTATPTATAAVRPALARPAPVGEARSRMGSAKGLDELEICAE